MIHSLYKRKREREGVEGVLIYVLIKHLTRALSIPMGRMVEHAAMKLGLVDGIYANAYTVCACPREGHHTQREKQREEDET